MAMDTLSAGCERWQIPAVTAGQMASIDEIMIRDIGIDLIQMMELAGRNLAHLARHRFLDGDPRGKHVVVLAGSGGNGGGGLVAARRLHGWCSRVEVWLSKPIEDFDGIPAHQLGALRRLGVSVHGPDDALSPGAPNVIIDALIGYRLSGEPAGTTRSLIDTANINGAPILSLDLPSGLDETTGHLSASCIRATATLTLGLPKTGLWMRGVHEVTGELYLGDISIPAAVYTRIGIEPGPIFAKDDILRIG